MSARFFGLIFLAAVLLAGCGQISRASSISSDYARELAKARKAGLPVSIAQLRVKSPPESENAAPIYMQLVKLWHDKPLVGRDTIIDGLSSHFMPYMPSANQIEDIRAALADRADLLRLVHQAASRPKCVFQHDWSNPDPNAFSVPELSEFRREADLLTAESLVMAAEGKGITAVRNQSLGFQTAKHAMGDPGSIGYLVGISAEGITLSGFQRILYITHGDPQVAQAVARAIEQYRKPLDLAAALRTEVAQQQSIVAMLRNKGPAGLDELLGTSIKGTAFDTIVQKEPAFWQKTMDQNGIYLLQIMPKIIAAADKPYPQAHAIMQPITEDINKPGDMTHFSHFVAATIFLDPDKLVEHRAEEEARAGSTQAGAALLVYRSAHGAFPAKLGDAIKPVPTDPFDDKPLRYKRDGAGFVVYSVGPSGKFDGGAATIKPGAGNVAFRYPLPAYDKADDSAKPSTPPPSAP